MRKSRKRLMKPKLKMTDFGWATESATQPRDVSLHWWKLPEGHLYTWDGDGWYRLWPQEHRFIAEELPHG